MDDNLPDPSSSYDMLENIHVWAKKRWELVYREEALHNLAFEAGVSQLPRSTFIGILQAFAISVGIVATLVAAVILILTVGWFVSAADELLRYMNMLPMMGFTFVLSLLLLTSIPYTRRHRAMLLYPPCIIKLYQQLITAGKIRVCEITGVESLSNSGSLFSYQFTPLEPIGSRRSGMGSTAPMPLIYRDNQAILKGKRQKLAQPQEALENVGASIGLTVPPVPGCCSGCASIYMLLLGSLGIVLGTLLLALSIGGFVSILSADSIHLDDIPSVSLMSMVGMVVFVHMGYRYFLQNYLARRYKEYLSQIYKQLIKHGEIVEGTITEVEQKIPQLIHYRFDAPSHGGICDGQYRLYTRISVTPGQKVTVLYLNRFVHILL